MTTYQPKLSNAELLAINSGINHVVLESTMQGNLESGERTLSVRFSRPVLKRPMTPKVAAFVLAWVKHHPRHWVLEITAHYKDGDLYYDETAELESYAKLDWLTEAYNGAVSDVTAAGNPRHLIGVSWRARVKSEAERRRGSA